jgi:hypothetical protein
MKIYDDIGILVPEVLLPKAGVDPRNWAVIAVDQFTSEPEYWDQVEDAVGDDPSTLRITLPEIYLGHPGEAERIQDIRNTMRQYLRSGILKSREGLIFVERTVLGKTRRGLMACLDLERYDYSEGATSLIRATEGTIIERLPARMKIREGAALELPHILVLIDDPQHTVIEPLIAARKGMEKLYEFDLMLGSGHLAGWAVRDESPVIAALRNLARPEVFAAKYGVGKDTPVMLFAIGDGNHSLATAKTVWEKMKPSVGPEHPSRYALVEIENVHDDALEFEPIHRVLFGVKKDFAAELQKHFGSNSKWTPVATSTEMIHTVAAHEATQRIGIVDGGHSHAVVEFFNPKFNIPTATIQSFLDLFLKSGGAEKMDFVHGDDVLLRIGSKPGHVGIYLPAMEKSDLFKAVILDGALPRKTFSMGEARSKRFYMEARKIN